MHRKSALQLPMMMMLGKEQLSGLECALSAVAIAVIFTLDLVSLSGVVGVCFEVPG